MAIQTDDCDIRDTSMFMQHGGNGDYYLTLIQFTERDKEDFKRLDMRFAMSGGCISKHPNVAKCIWELYRALDAAGLNKHPKELTPANLSTK